MTKEENEKIIVLGNYMPSEHNASRIIDPEGIVPAVMENHGTVMAIMEKEETIAMGDFRYDEGFRIRKNESPTLSVATTGKQIVVFEQTKRGGDEMSDIRIRRITPKEAWRLMGFDDEDFEKAAKVSSKNKLYKQAGNSIVVNVLEAILKNLLFENEEEGIRQTEIWDYL